MSSSISETYERSSSIEDIFKFEDQENADIAWEGELINALEES